MLRQLDLGCITARRKRPGRKSVQIVARKSHRAHRWRRRKPNTAATELRIEHAKVEPDVMRHQHTASEQRPNQRGSLLKRRCVDYIGSRDPVNARLPYISTRIDQRRELIHDCRVLVQTHHGDFDNTVLREKQSRRLDIDDRKTHRHRRHPNPPLKL
ncbi:MAG: hypothetical protein ABSG64_13185 [Solirubrobacteraceae bacterium]